MLDSRFIAFCADIAAIAVALLVTPLFSTLRRVLLALIALSVVISLLPTTLATGGYLVCALAATLIAIWSIYDRRRSSLLWLRLFSNPMLLQPPFRGRWKTAAGGPDPRYNHHQIARDQYFAYDFIREDRESWESEILAPCDGRIAFAEDGHDDALPRQRRRDSVHPAGNYVTIETPRGYVILAHLKKGTIAVREGTPVRAGDLIARCGNSGNTSQSHLHVHAQNEPRTAINRASGIPISFGTMENPYVLRYGDVIASD